jgi:hypothetical protein
MEEYGLSPDQLIAKAFRVIQSCQPGYKPNSKTEWVAEIKKIYKRKGVAGLQRLQKNHPHLYLQAKWLFGGMDEGFRFVGLDAQKSGSAASTKTKDCIERPAGSNGKDSRFIRAT